MSEVYRKHAYLLVGVTRRKTQYHDITVRTESSISGGTALGLYPEQVERELGGEDSDYQSPDVLNQRGR